jgi:hypothetical protein
MHICKKQNFQTTKYLQSDDLVPLTFASFAWKKQQIVGKKKVCKKLQEMTNQPCR